MAQRNDQHLWQKSGQICQHKLPRHVPGALEIAITKDPRCQMEISTVCKGTSNHNPLILEVGTSENQFEEEVIINKIDRKNFKIKLDDKLGPIPKISSRNEIEAAITALEEGVNTTMEQCKRTIKRQVLNKYGEVHDNVQELIRKKNGIRRLVQRNRTTKIVG